MEELKQEPAGPSNLEKSKLVYKETVDKTLCQEDEIRINVKKSENVNPN